MTTPIIELAEVPQAILEAADEINSSFRKLDAITQLVALSYTTTSPPSSPVQGLVYIVPEDATGAWSGKANRVAYWGIDASTNELKWLFATPRNGWLAVIVDEDLQIWQYKSSLNSWVEYTPSSGTGGGSNVGKSADDIPSIADPADDEFEVDGALDTSGSRFSGATPWSWRNQGTSTFAVSDGSGELTPELGTGYSLRLVEQTAPGGTWKFRAKISGKVDAQDNAVGMHVAKNSSGKTISTTVYAVNASPNTQNLGLNVQKSDNATTFNSNSVASAAGTVPGAYFGALPWMYVEWEYNGTNVITRVSATGREGSFVQVFSESAATFLGGAPDRVGLLAACRSATVPVVLACEWFRRVA